MRKGLEAARRGKNDEFYTQLTDIEKELSHYTPHFKDKIVYCNCDDPRVSNFFHYFSHNFAHLGLKKLITTCYRNQNPGLFSQHNSERAIMLEYDGFRKVSAFLMSKTSASSNWNATATFAVRNV